MAVTIDSLITANQAGLHALEERLGYRFRDLRRLQQALVHRSYAYEQGRGFTADNETLEFLGDAVLDLAVGSTLFERFPAMREGELTRLRAALVNEGHLAVMARAVDLGPHLLLGRGEEVSRGREKASILASAYEALLGAVFLDAGYESAARLVEDHFAEWFGSEERLLFVDSKSKLQELLQERYNEGPVYLLENEEGPAHQKRFTISVRFRGVPLATGMAGNKKEAEQQAAARAVEQLRAGTLPLPD
ncbi:MAG: ribonuclease III [Desulfobacteraceae bacterium]|nr:ribonuclease III [Desulfobacteraceae bacterium]